MNPNIKDLKSVWSSVKEASEQEQTVMNHTNVPGETGILDATSPEALPVTEEMECFTFTETECNQHKKVCSVGQHGMCRPRGMHRLTKEKNWRSVLNNLAESAGQPAGDEGTSFDAERRRILPYVRVLLENAGFTWRYKLHRYVVPDQSKIRVTCHLMPLQRNYNRQKTNTFETRFNITSQEQLQDQFWNIVDEFANKFYFKGPDGPDPSQNPGTMQKMSKYLFAGAETLSEVFQKCMDVILEQDTDINLQEIGKQNGTWVQMVNVSDDGKLLTFGDLHSSIGSFCTILLKNKHFFQDDSLTLREKHYIVFTGDIIDRGPFGYQMLCLISIMLIKNKSQVFVCSGNHEECSAYNRYGMQQESDFYNDKNRCMYGIQSQDSSLKFMDYLPCACVFKTPSGNILFNHGAAPIETLVPGFNESVQTGRSFLVKDEYDVLLWGDYCAGDANEPMEGNRGGVVVSFRLAKEFMQSLSIMQIISGHQDLVNYACFKEPEDKDNYYDINSAHSYQGNAWVLRSPLNLQDTKEIDVTSNKVHVHSSAIYSKYDREELCNHCFLIVTF